MKKHYLIPLVFLILVSITVNGQNSNNAQPELESGTIENQFDYILTQSTRWKEFQLIRKSSLLKVKEHALDSLKKTQKDFIAEKKRANQSEAKMISLENNIFTLQGRIDIANKRIDNISAFGLSLSKTNYNLMVWSIITILVLLLIIILIRFKSNQVVTKTTRHEIAKIESEFESYRKNSLKKEQEIMRKLQDEINKNSY